MKGINKMKKLKKWSKNIGITLYCGFAVLVAWLTIFARYTARFLGKLLWYLLMPIIAFALMSYYGIKERRKI